DLSDAILEASQRALAGSEVKLNFAMQGVARSIGHVTEHHLLRVCEEALANVVKHAQSTEVEVVLDFNSQAVQLEVRDNGCGFQPNTCKISKAGHFGLLGMQERVASLFGMLSVDSAPGRGTKLLVTIPAKRDCEDGCIANDVLMQASQLLRCANGQSV